MDALRVADPENDDRNRRAPSAQSLASSGATPELPESRVELEHRVFHSILSSIRDYVYTFDRQGRFLYANQSLLDLLGLRYEDVVGKTMTELGYPPDVEKRLFE